MATTPTTPPAGTAAKPTVATAAPAAAPASAVKPTVAQPQATMQAVRAPAFKIREVQQRERYLKLLIYGNYGTGKTHLAGTASQVPEMGDILLINAESGDLTLDAFTGIDEITIQTFRVLGRVYEFLVQHCKLRDANDEEGLKKLQTQVFPLEPDQDPEEVRVRKYRTVIVDSLSEVEQYSMNQILGITDTTKIDEDPNAAEWKEFKQNHTLILRLVRAFRNLPMHVIFTCAEAYTQDETKKMKYTLDLTGKLSKKVQGFMDMVGYLVPANTKAPTAPGTPVAEDAPAGRRLYVTPSTAGRYDAKHRYVNFKGTHFDDPTIKKILDQTGLLKGGVIVRS